MTSKRTGRLEEVWELVNPTEPKPRFVLPDDAKPTLYAMLPLKYFLKGGGHRARCYSNKQRSGGTTGAGQGNGMLRSRRGFDYWASVFRISVVGQEKAFVSWCVVVGHNPALSTSLVLDATFPLVVHETPRHAGHPTGV